MLQPSVNNRSHKTQWSSSATFILAGVGAAVGLGNIWRFPYVVGQNGGGAFMVIYLITIFAVVTPILIGELLVGRRGQMSPPRSVAKIAVEVNISPWWQSIGWIGISISILILSFYSVIAGWLIAYIPKTLSGDLAGLSGAEITDVFANFLANPQQLLIWHTLFMTATIITVTGGIRRGIEWVARYLMPLLFLLLVGLVIYSVIVGDLRAAVDFLFKPDFSRITYQTVITAIGQAFFSVGVGGCMLMNYAAYLPKHTSIARSAFVIAGADTLVAILAGIAIFPIIFEYNLDPTAGPGLIFISLSVAFASISYGEWIGAAFFILLLIAAFTSSIAILDPVARLGEEKGSNNRKKFAIVGGFLSWLLGILTLLSFNIWADFARLGFISDFSSSTFYDLLDGLISLILLPVGGLLLAIFVGWRLPNYLVMDELRVRDDKAYFIWISLLKYVGPVAIAALFLSGLYNIWPGG